MNKTFPFIGRQNLQDDIDSLVRDQRNNLVICIEADKGIGKTRLLQELFRKYTCDANFIAVNIFDFDNEIFLSPNHIGSAIAEKLDENVFNPYILSQKEYRRLTIAGSGADERNMSRQKMRKIFSECFNKISETKRIILFFDTTEKLEKDKGMWKEFENIAQLNNARVLLAGRNAHQIGNWLQESGTSSVINITLRPLDEKESFDYITKKQDIVSTVRLKNDIALKLIKLSAGKPILLDLAVEWYYRNISLEWLDDISIDCIDKREYQKKFESNLLQRIKELSHPIDRIVQIMTYIYPLDEEMLSRFMDIDAHKLMETADEYVFIKRLPGSPGGYITLHDAVRTMAREYVFPISIIENLNEIKKYSKEAVSYFAEKTKEIKKEIKRCSDYREKENLYRQYRNLMKRQVGSAFLIDNEEGMKNYKEIISKLRRDSMIGFAFHIESTIDVEKLNQYQLRKYDIIHARLLNDSGKTDEAKSILEKILLKVTADSEEKADVYNALATVNLRKGNLQSAKENQINAIKIAKKIGKDYLPSLYNYAGYIYERLGITEKAIENYNQAITCSLINKEVDIRADIEDNLSRAYCQEGFYEYAQNHLDEAKKLLENSNEDSVIARREITQGMIYRYKEKYHESLRCLNNAINILDDEHDDHKKLVKAYFHRGWTYYVQAVDMDINKEYLEKSLHDFKFSLELAKKYNLNIEIPGILHQMSHVYHQLGEKNKAVELNNSAYDESLKFNDIQYAIDSLVGKAEFDYANGQDKRIDEYANILYEQYEEEGYYKFPLFYGRMKIIIAEIALKEGKYDSSLEKYIDGLAQMRDHGGSEVQAHIIDKELEKLEKKMQLLPDDIFSMWCFNMSEAWGTRKPLEKYAKMVTWCHRCQQSRQSQ